MESFLKVPVSYRDWQRPSSCGNREKQEPASGAASGVGAAQEKRTGPLASSALRHLSGSLRGRARNSVGRPALGTLWGAAGERPARGEPAALPAEPPATTCREVSRSKLTLEADIFAAGGPGGRDAGASSSEGRARSVLARAARPRSC